MPSSIVVDNLRRALGDLRVKLDPLDTLVQTDDRIRDLVNDLTSQVRSFLDTVESHRNASTIQS